MVSRGADRRTNPEASRAKASEIALPKRLPSSLPASRADTLIDGRGTESKRHSAVGLVAGLGDENGGAAHVSHATPRTPENDGHRTVLRRADETAVLYARSGRVVTQHWMDLAVAGMELCPGTVLDGEAVVWRDVRLGFAAAQSWAGSSVTRARTLAARYPASYVCWDVLQHPDPAIGDCRRRPCTERRAFLLELLVDVGPPCRRPTTGTSPCSGKTRCASRASRGSSANAVGRAIRRQGSAGG
ncbi:hypothetical protein [Streptomyces sp. NPDC056255]|uniref:ATP-dependent DNA ligase n=1 Tax=Streptomyces sp. NPDC056255 TaxID=3345764 RepID=UPI0035D9D441